MENIKNGLTKIKLKDTQIERGGVPLVYEGDYAYVSAYDYHTLTIGAQGSGKTQSVMLPSIKIGIKAGESFVIYDASGDIRERLMPLLEKYNYNVYSLDMDKEESQSNFNPFVEIHNIYKEGKYDSAIKLLEEVSSQIIRDSEDPFWKEQSEKLFIGICLFAFEQNSNDINFDTISQLLNSFENSVLANLDEQSLSYKYLLSIKNMPIETKQSVVASLEPNLANFTMYPGLCKKLSISSFELKNVLNEKHAIFITGIDFVKTFIPLFVKEYIYIKKYYDNKNRVSMHLDGFDYLDKYTNLVLTQMHMRSYGVKLYLYISGISQMENVYKDEVTPIIGNCGNVIYLLSQDYKTIEYIGHLYGKSEELKTLELFEAIVISLRKLPFKTKLVPDYKINY